jgi:hypothetical protein
MRVFLREKGKFLKEITLELGGVCYPIGLEQAKILASQIENCAKSYEDHEFLSSFRRFDVTTLSLIGFALSIKEEGQSMIYYDESKFANRTIRIYPIKKGYYWEVCVADGREADGIANGTCSSIGDTVASAFSALGETKDDLY